MTIACGVFFYSTETSRYLYLLRSKEKTWSLPGGKIEKEETLLEGVSRECFEEIGYFPSNGKLIPIQKFTHKSFVYHTFFCNVETEFIPILNHEHCGYAWVGEDQYPRPLHPGLFNTVNFDIVQSKLILLTKNDS